MARCGRCGSKYTNGCENNRCVNSNDGYGRDSGGGLGGCLLTLTAMIAAAGVAVIAAAGSRE